MNEDWLEEKVKKFKRQFSGIDESMWPMEHFLHAALQEAESRVKEQLRGEIEKLKWTPQIGPKEETIYVRNGRRTNYANRAIGENEAYSAVLALLSRTEE